MVIVTQAVFDGKVLQPKEPLAIPANSLVRVTIESEEPEPKEAQKGAPYSFFDTALSMRLDGPPDWSENLDRYLYGELHDDAG